MPMIPQLDSAACPARSGRRPQSRGRISELWILVVVTLAVGLQGCAGLKRRGESSQTANSEVTAGSGQEDSGQTASAEEISPSGETATISEPPKTVVRPAVLVFGPGQARALATLGVLQGWQEAGLPLAEIYASETSALVAALFASSRTVSECEWKLLKIRAECFVDQDSLLGGLFSRRQDASCIEDAIDADFGAMTFRDLRIPLRVGFEDELGSVVWTNSGSVAAALKNSYRSVALHGVEDRPHAIRSDSAFPVARIRTGFSGPVVAVEYFTASRTAVRPRPSGSGVRGPISEGFSRSMQEREKQFEAEMREVADRSADGLKEADFVIRPFERKLALPYLDHLHRQEAISAGRAALEEQLSGLSNLTGVSHE